MNEGYIKIQKENRIGTIFFFHPKSNSLTSLLLNEFRISIEQLSVDNDIKVIVIRSEGEKTFCGGASFNELVSIQDYNRGKEFFMGFARLINSMRKSPKFIIARIQGKTVGGGVGLAAASDYVLALSNSDVRLSELALGIGPFVVGPAVERKIGKGAFSHMSIDYDWHSAEWAKKNGLFSEVFSSIEKLDEAVFSLSSRLAAGSSEAMRELKRVLWEGTNTWDTLLEQRAEISGKLVLSDFTKKYIKEFKSK